MTHTPGPWEVRQCDGGYRVCDTNDYAIVNDGCITPALVFGGFSEGAANARLISAAPDMLKALQSARSFLTATYGWPMPNEAFRGFVEAIIDPAISKATKEDNHGTDNR